MREQKPLATTMWAQDATEPWARIPPHSVHVLSCQLALHYFMETEAKMKGFCDQVLRSLHPHGCAILSFVDGRSIVRRGRDALARRIADEAPIAGEVFEVGTAAYTAKIPLAHLQPLLPSPFGLQYVFTTPGCVVEVPEWLCHEACVLHNFKKYLECALSLSFDEAYHDWSHRSMFKDILENMVESPPTLPELDVANLYRILILGPREFHKLLRL